jgi:hypothetical protein
MGNSETDIKLSPALLGLEDIEITEVKLRPDNKLLVRVFSTKK